MQEITEIRTLKVLWQHETIQRNKPTIIDYVDFEICGIDGVFRVTDIKGVNLEKAVNQILKNITFFKYLCKHGVSNVLSESKTFKVVTKNYQWLETKHLLLASMYRLTIAYPWYTTPFRGNQSEVLSVMQKHEICNDGVTLLDSSDDTKHPVMVCYFFPSLGVK
jgi:hypothetical protein